MKKLFFTALATVVFAFANVANAQSLNEVLDMHFKATGQEKLMAVQSFYIKAKISQMGMEMPMEIKIKNEKFIVTIDLQGQKIITAFDGEKGWMINPMMGAEPQQLAGDQLVQARQQANMMEGELFNYEAKGHSAELAGKVNVDGKEMYRIKLTTKDGNTNDYLIDATTNLVSKVKSKVSAQGQTVDVEQIMGDYKTIDGITMAMKIESKTPMGNAVILMEEVKMNETFDDSVFKQPVK